MVIAVLLNCLYAHWPTSQGGGVHDAELDTRMHGCIRQGDADGGDAGRSANQRAGAGIPTGNTREDFVRIRKEVTSRSGKTCPTPEWDGTPWPPFRRCLLPVEQRHTICSEEAAHL